jgi:hypothetical protein
MLGVPCGASSANALKAPRRASSAGLTQHPDQHRPHRPILLAVDQKLAGRTSPPTSSGPPIICGRRPRPPRRSANADEAQLSPAADSFPDSDRRTRGLVVSQPGLAMAQYALPWKLFPIHVSETRDRIHARVVEVADRFTDVADVDPTCVGAARRTRRSTCNDPALELIGPHGRRLTPSTVPRGSTPGPARRRSSAEVRASRMVRT